MTKEITLNKARYIYIHCSKISILKLVIILHGLTHFFFFMLSISTILEIQQCELLNASGSVGENYQFTFIQIVLLAD